MNKIFKKVISLALIGTLCIGASTTTFASELSPEAKARGMNFFGHIGLKPVSAVAGR